MSNYVSEYKHAGRGIQMVHSYYSFMGADYIPDAIQIVHLLILEIGDRDIDVKEFGRRLNRLLYRYAVEMGFRKAIIYEDGQRKQKWIKELELSNKVLSVK